MTSARPTQLTISAFRSIRDPLVVDFPEAGLVLLRGTNVATGSSSGAGKSNLLLALAFAFDYAPYPATVLQCLDTDEPMLVQVQLATDVGPAILTRGAKNSLEVGLYECVKGSVAAVKARLKTLVGLSPDLLQALTYRGQRSGASFLSKTDAEKKEFLAAVIPELAQFEKLADESDAKAKKLWGDLQVEEAVYAMAVQGLQAARDAVKPLEPHGLGRLAAAERAAAEVMLARAAEVATHRETVSAARNAAAHAGSHVREEMNEALRPLRAQSDAIAAEQAPAATDTSALDQQLTFQSECRRRLAAAKVVDALKAEAQEHKLFALSKDIHDFDAIADTEPALREELSRAQDDLRKASEHLCPTCDQHWEENATGIEMLRLTVCTLDLRLLDVDRAREASAKLRAQLAEHAPFVPNPAIAKLEAAAQVIAGNIATERAKLSGVTQAWEAQRTLRSLAVSEQTLAVRTEAEARLRMLVEEWEPQIAANAAALAEAEAKLAAAVQEHTLATGAYSLALARNKDLEEQHEEAVQCQERAEAREQALREKLEKLRAAHALEADLAQLAGNNGFLGAIFDEILAEIANENNAILAAVPNTADIVLRFRSETTTQKGTSKRAIAPVVTVRGREVPLSSGISGGQMTSVELATDLAVSRVVSRRTGITPGWLILDEPFNGLGIIEKEACLEILSVYAQDRLVIVVDHDSVFKEMFVKTIDLEFRDGVTTVRQ